ncbi:Carbohydrate acetyl esterase/feruloyl esterase precursor [Planctomycetes bacterium CA13]|uniref:Carbohydrate acetyl esterase/feruloyl esterase n=1 Tax=Novipirellula herctigrandis TaxID=2527986 RepID=A0A5C5YUT7_9BACT|nr:Carbohydrate acetyl esterase/feruloyl esterase precursor [Planctomycetes bacterium CA13]
MKIDLMIHQQIRRMPLLVACALVAFLFAGPTQVCGQRTRDQRPPVSWVNPDLPNGPGLTHKVLSSKAMGHDVGYVVFTPADYDASGNTRYPVIYFLHGMGGTEASDSAGFASHIARGVRDDSIPPVICVFPNGGRSGYRGSVETMILTELIPLIDESYPTKAEAKSRVVAGFSMGGAGAVQLSVMHPELFCAAGSWGGGMWRDADATLAAAVSGAETLRGNGYAALLVNGDQDRPQAFKPLAEKFKELEIPHEVVVLPDTPHNLGMYYQRAGAKMIQFLGKRLQH